MRVRPPRSVAELLDFAEPMEPAATRFVGEARRHGLSRTNRAVVVEDGGGIVGALLINRRCRGRWNALPVLADARPDAANRLAAEVDRSPAWALIGGARHVGPVLAHLRRRIRPTAYAFHGSHIPPPDVDAVRDRRMRLAVRDDLDALVRLYDASEQHDIPTRPRLRRFLTDALRDVPIVVAELDSRIVGAVRCDWLSRSYAFWWAQVVLPEYRGLGLGNSLLFTAMAHSGAQGLKVCGVIGPTNPTRPMQGESWRPYEEYRDGHWEDEWLVARMGPPRTSLVHRASRRGLEMLEGRTGRRVARPIRG